MTTPYKQLWGIVEGATTDAFKTHPDYLTPKGKRSAVASVTKRVTGTVLGFAEASARGAAGSAETDGASSIVPSTGEAGMRVSPNQHCRIVRVRLKRRSRYRSPQAFDLKLNELREAVARRGLLKSVRG